MEPLSMFSFVLVRQIVEQPRQEERVSTTTLRIWSEGNMCFVCEPTKPPSAYLQWQSLGEGPGFHAVYVSRHDWAYHFAFRAFRAHEKWNIHNEHWLITTWLDESLFALGTEACRTTWVLRRAARSQRTTAWTIDEVEIWPGLINYWQRLMAGFGCISSSAVVMVGSAGAISPRSGSVMDPFCADGRTM